MNIEQLAERHLLAELDRMTVPAIVTTLRVWARDAADHYNNGRTIDYTETVRDIMQAALALADRKPA